MEQLLEFANDVVSRIDNSFDVLKVWFRDGAHFHLNGYDNKQNWCLQGAAFVDGTVTSKRYCVVLSNNFIPVIQSDPEFDLMWFIEVGAGPHRISNVFALLEEHF
ncbi:uncharacterized protein NPIL_218881 [Nephila pilipes]|uniref:Uncharacterized protein n=1 Tax=Nephila pilipes TaxID=299642 RepID=A0A8X6QCA1_NEPPI|nr:uncharacterized protein NPIL_218881 [Nephila pilipes]